MFRLSDDESALEWHDTGMRKTVFSMFSSAQHKSIPLIDVIGVRKGVQTDTLKGAVNCDPYCSLSFLTSQRSLDLNLNDNKDREMVYRAMQELFKDRPEVVFS